MRAIYRSAANIIQSYMVVGDLLVIVLVLGLGLGSILFLWNTSGGSAEPTHVQVRSLSGGDEDIIFRKELPAEADEVIEGELGELKLQVSGYRARITESSCPDQVCVKTGWVSRPGDKAVCVPNQVVLEIVGEKQDEFDEIVK